VEIGVGVGVGVRMGREDGSGGVLGAIVDEKEGFFLMQTLLKRMGVPVPRLGGSFFIFQ